MNKQVFFNAIRLSLFKTLSQSQVQGMEYLLEESYKHGFTIPELAYCLATAYHETAYTMMPIAEYGRGKGRKYGVPVPPYNHIYYGRGYVQLTWSYNYVKAGDILNVDLLRYPDKAMDPKIAADVLYYGMKQGWFTGRKLSDYIAGTKKDYVNARRIVNGTDKATTIGEHAVKFENALSEALYGKEPTSIIVDVPAPKPVAPVAPAVPSWAKLIIETLKKIMGSRNA